MHFRIRDAFGHNGLLVSSIPLLGMQWGYTLVFPNAKPLSARNWVVLSWGIMAIGWGILRNLPAIGALGH
jgi:hypothetical protein